MNSARTLCCRLAQAIPHHSSSSFSSLGRLSCSSDVVVLSVHARVWDRCGIQQRRLLRTSSVLPEPNEKKQSLEGGGGGKEQKKGAGDRSRWPFHMTMTEEQKEKKQQKIDAANAEAPPSGIFAKVKFYLKRYWYIALPAHAISCTMWFAALYALVQSGVDVPNLLHTLHLPDWIVEKVRSTPPSAGVFVVALLLYKIVIPFRYLTTLGFIKVIFATLRKTGKLKTAREVEYKVRSDYEVMKNKLGRRSTNYEGKGVRTHTRRMQETPAGKIVPEKPKQQ